MKKSCVYFLLIPLFLLSGCRHNGDQTNDIQGGQLNIRLLWPDTQTNHSSQRLAFPLPSTVTDITIYITDGEENMLMGTDGQLLEAFFTIEERYGLITGVPAGKDRMVHVDAYDSNSTLLYSGVKDNVVVENYSTTEIINIEMFASGPTTGLIISPSASLEISEGKTESLAISLSAAPKADVVVTIIISNADEITASTKALTFTVNNWSQPQSVLLTAVVDQEVDSQEVNIYLDFGDSVDENYKVLEPHTILVTTVDSSSSVASGGSSSSSSSPSSPSSSSASASGPLMGGSVQNGALSLTGQVTTFSGSRTTGNVDGSSTAAAFDSPYGITTDGNSLYVTQYSSSNAVIRKISLADGSVSTMAGLAGQVGNVDGTGTSAQFNRPAHVTTDGTNLYVVDQANFAIRKVVIATGIVTTLAVTFENAVTPLVPSSSTKFSNPAGITTDKTNLYVTDSDANVIRKVVIATGAVTTFAGTIDTSGLVDGAATAARFSQPMGITTDGTNLYVADRLNYSVRKIVIATGTVTTLAGKGFYAIGDGTGTAAGFGYLNGITTDGINVYVTDHDLHTVRKIVIATGAVTTLAGIAGTFGFGNGTGTAVLFNLPHGIVATGNALYIADNQNAIIRKLN